MKLEEIEVEDLDDLSVKQKDRIAAEWLGGVKDRSNTKDIFVEYNYLWESEGRTWPRYSEWWGHCGRLLEALPDEIRIDNLRDGGDIKYSIVKKACFCAVKGIEPKQDSS